jgi:hypothetical protein
MRLNTPSAVLGGRAALQRREKDDREPTSLRRRPARSVAERAMKPSGSRIALMV